jgi:hypothetical protein
VIGGISSQIGFTEEKPDLFALRPPPDKGFDKALERAATQPDPHEPSKTASETRLATRRRALFEERDEEPRTARERKESGAPADDDKVAGEEGRSGKKLPARAPSAEGRDSVQNRAPSEPLSEADQAVAYPDGTVLENAEIDPDVAGRQAMAAHLSGIGLVAYQQSAHGIGEEQAAADLGLMLKPPVKRGESPELQVAAQAIEAGELLVKVQPEEKLPTKSARQLMPGLVSVAKPEELKDEALGESALQNGVAKPDSKSDAARLALLNSMRQPPPGAHAAAAGAFALESGAGLKDSKIKGEGGEGSRASIQAVPRGAELAQAQATTPNLTPSDRSAFGALQRPDASQPPLMERVVHEVRWMIRNDRSEATIRLEPDHLGSMRIKVVHHDGTLRIDMTVDNHQARSLIESRMSDLQQRLNLQDLGAEQFSLNVNVQDNSGWDSFKQPAQASRAMPYLPVSREPAGVEHATTAAMSRPVWGRAGVGIYV